MDRLQHLTLRANRTLGATLINEGLLSPEGMSQANDRFLSAFRSGDWITSSLLRILAWEMKVLPESILIRHQMEKYRVPIISLQNYAVNASLLNPTTLEGARATRTLPIDCLENAWFLVTAYYLSNAVLNYWDEQLPGSKFWYIAKLDAIEQTLTSMENLPSSTLSA